MSDIDYYVRLVNLPATIKGMISVDAEGFYSIYINANLSTEEQKDALEHELNHARREHLHCDTPVGQCEKEAAS